MQLLGEGGLGEGYDFTGDETLGFCFRLELVFQALAPQMLEVTTRGGVAVYGYLLTAIRDTVGPVLDEGFGARHGGVFEGRRYGCAGKGYRFVKGAERLLFEAGGM